MIKVQGGPEAKFLRHTICVIYIRPITPSLPGSLITLFAQVTEQHLYVYDGDNC